MNSRFFYIAGAVILVLIGIFFIIRALVPNGPPPVTALVERGEVRSLVSVSGVIEAENAANLAFPVTGIVQEILVDEGDLVNTNDILAKLQQRALLAERADAAAALQIAIADRDELLSGPRSESRDVTQTEVQNAEENLARVTAEENEKVENARRALFSSNLEVESTDADTTTTAPTVSGTYECETQGSYKLNVFLSNSRSGYSYKLFGLEKGTYEANVDSAAAFGNCGLAVQFVEGELYGNTDWRIDVPNTSGANYVTNLNAYELALQNRDNNIEAAAETLALLQREQILENAAPRTEELARADATVAQARARLEAADAAIGDRTLVAPFAGSITDVDTIVGETVTNEPVITLLSEDEFEITARIPEIDIAKVLTNQTAEVVFDARTSETLTAEIIFISPVATEIDGVAYFEAKLRLQEPPVWLRSGLNADVEIVVEQANNVLRLPQRFLKINGKVATVIVNDNGRLVERTVSIGQIGNDGFIEVIGLSEGTEVVAPEGESSL